MFKSSVVAGIVAAVVAVGSGWAGTQRSYTPPATAKTAWLCVAANKTVTWAGTTQRSATDSCTSPGSFLVAVLTPTP